MVNTDTKTRIGEVGQKDSNLDLIICNDKLYNKVKYKIEKNSWGSDHFPLKIELKIEIGSYRKRTNRISKRCITGMRIRRSLVKWNVYLTQRSILNLTEEDKYKVTENCMIQAVMEASGKEIKNGRGNVILNCKSILIITV